ncbi:platelet binding protein GspB-like [Rhagoletis pomonella]|uniref:platelet binding protein GspB-like n=1 Tax=Rhagoletis pomonella TaxID=28610 RepID=UPI001782F0FE|nr:platelet binding protein GspB-like [Rhagoletis pomonella]
MGPVLPPRSVMSGLPAHHYSTPMNFRKGLAARWHRWRCALNICLAVFALLGLISIVLYVSGVLHLSIDEPRTILVGNEASEVTAAKSTNTDLTKFGQPTTVTASTATSSLSSISASQAAAAQAAAAASAAINGNGGLLGGSGINGGSGIGGGTSPSSTAYQSPASASSAVAAIGTPGAVASSPSSSLSSSLANANNGGIRYEVLPAADMRATWSHWKRVDAHKTTQQKWKHLTKDNAAPATAAVTHLSTVAQRKGLQQQKYASSDDWAAVVATSGGNKWQKHKQHIKRQQQQNRKLQTPLLSRQQQHGVRKKRYRRSLMTDQSFASIDLITKTLEEYDDMNWRDEGNNGKKNKVTERNWENGGGLNDENAKHSGSNTRTDDNSEKVADSFEVVENAKLITPELELDAKMIELAALPVEEEMLANMSARLSEVRKMEDLDIPAHAQRQVSDTAADAEGGNLSKIPSTDAEVGTSSDSATLTHSIQATINATQTTASDEGNALPTNLLTATNMRCQTPEKGGAQHKCQMNALPDIKGESNFVATAEKRENEVKDESKHVLDMSAYSAQSDYDNNNNKNAPNSNQTPVKPGGVATAQTLQINNVLGLNQSTNNDKKIAVSIEVEAEEEASSSAFEYDDDASDEQHIGDTLTTIAKVLSKAFEDKNNEVAMLIEKKTDATHENDAKIYEAAGRMPSKTVQRELNVDAGRASDVIATLATPPASTLVPSDIYNVAYSDIDYVEGNTQRQGKDFSAALVNKVNRRKLSPFKATTEINEISMTTDAPFSKHEAKMRGAAVEKWKKAYKAGRSNLHGHKVYAPAHSKKLKKQMGRALHAPDHVLTTASRIAQLVDAIINDDNQIDRPPAMAAQKDEEAKEGAEQVSVNNECGDAAEIDKNVAANDDNKIGGGTTKKSHNEMKERTSAPETTTCSSHSHDFDDANDFQINRHNRAANDALSDSESDMLIAATDDNNNERDLVDSYDDGDYDAHTPQPPSPALELSAGTSNVIKIDKSERNEQKQQQQQQPPSGEYVEKQDARSTRAEWQENQAPGRELEIKLNGSQTQNGRATTIEQNTAIAGVHVDADGVDDVETTTTTTTKQTIMVTADERQTMEINELTSVARKSAAERGDRRKSDLEVFGGDGNENGAEVEEDVAAAKDQANVKAPVAATESETETVAERGYSQMTDIEVVDGAGNFPQSGTTEHINATVLHASLVGEYACGNASSNSNDYGNLSLYSELITGSLGQMSYGKLGKYSDRRSQR